LTAKCRALLSVVYCKRCLPAKLVHGFVLSYVVLCSAGSLIGAEGVGIAAFLINQETTDIFNGTSVFSVRQR